MSSSQRPQSLPPRRGRVVLVYPLTGIDVPGVSVFLPLSIMTVGGALEANGFEVELLDMRTDPHWEKTLRTAVSNGPLYVGISAMTGRQIHFGLKAAEAVRKADATIPLVWGGIHAEVLPEETLADALVDVVAVGDGDTAAVDIARAIAGGEAESVLGKVVLRHAGEGRSSLDQHPVDLTRLDTAPYITPIVHRATGLAHVTSRGCPHHCGYCYNQAVHGAKWRSDSAEAVLAHLEQIARLGIGGVIFFDDNFFVNRKRVERIARGIIERGLSFAIKADCRADYIVRYDIEFLRLIRSAGFQLLYIGAESGSDHMLEAIDKGEDVETTLKANRKLAEADIRPHYSFMCGLPGETVDDMRATISLMKQLKTEHPGAYLSPVKAYVPYPGTSLFEVAKRAGFAPPTSLAGWSEFDWNPTPRPWLSKSETRFVQKMVYATTALDPSVVELAGISQGPIATWGFQRFAALCRARCDKANLGLMPELPFIRLARRIVAQIR